MRFIVLSLVFALLPLPLWAHGASKAGSGQTAQPVMTNQDVIRLVKAKVSDDSIIAKIKQSKTKFDTSHQGVVALIGAGVSDRVISFMMNPSEASEQSAGLPASPNQLKDSSSSAPGPIFAGKSCADVGSPDIRGGTFIEGTVRDSTGAPIPGALVIVVRGNVTFPSGRTDVRGQYFFTHFTGGRGILTLRQFYDGRDLDRIPIEWVDGKDNHFDIQYQGLASDLPWHSEPGDVSSQIAEMERKSRDGDPEATLNLASFLEQGANVYPDAGRAFALLQDLANKGNPRAIQRLGRMYVAGQATPRDISHALSLMRKAAEIDATGQIAFDLGSSLRSGQEFRKDPMESLCWYEKAAEKRNTQALGYLGDLYFGNSEFARAAYWYRKAVAVGGPYAAHYASKLDDANMKISPSFASDFIEQLKSKADAGDFSSQCDLAGRYAEGDGIAKDYAAAIRYATLAANNPNVSLTSPNTDFQRKNYMVHWLRMIYEGVELDHYINPPDYKQAYYWAERDPWLDPQATQNPNADQHLKELKLLAGVVDRPIDTAGASTQGNYQGEVERQRAELERADKEDADRQQKIQQLQSHLKFAQDKYDRAVSAAEDMDRQAHTGNAAADMIAQIGVNKFRQDAEKAKQEVGDIKSQLESLGAEAEQAQQKRNSPSEAIAEVVRQTPTIQETLNQQQGELNQAGAEIAARQAERRAVQQSQRQAQQGMQAVAPRGTGCSTVNNLVTVKSQWRTGVGALDHEVVVFVTNNATFPVSVSVRYHKNGKFDSGSSGLVHVSPGQTQGGEYQGLWDSADDSSGVQYIAYRKDSTDTHGNSCIGLPW